MVHIYVVAELVKAWLKSVQLQEQDHGQDLEMVVNAAGLFATPKFTLSNFILFLVVMSRSILCSPSKAQFSNEIQNPSRRIHARRSPCKARYTTIVLPN